jgi:molecular chaperone HscB
VLPLRGKTIFIFYKRMNYFELFRIPVTLQPDKGLVRRRFLELSKENHPDYFVNNPRAEQDTALEVSALLNKAWATFGNTDETIKYVLTLKGLLEEEEKYQLSPDFLMEMMEMNEELAEAQEDPGKKTEIEQRLESIEKEIYEPVQNIIENYQEGVTSEKELLQVKDYYFRKKYLKRLHHQLSGKL